MDLPQIDLRLPQKTAFGVQKVAADKSLFSSLFTFDIPQRKWLVYEDDVEIRNSLSTKATSVDYEGSFKSLGGKVLVTSRRHARYQPNTGYYYAGAGYFVHKTVDAVARWGIGTDENRQYFEYDNGVLYCCRRVLGVDYKEVFTELNPKADLTKNFLFDIQVQMRNMGGTMYYITTNLGTSIHHIPALGIESGATSPNPQLPCFFEIEAGTEDQEMRLGCVNAASEGGGEPTEEYGSAAFLDTSTGNGTVVAAIRQPTSINGKENTRDVRLSRITFNCEKKANYEVYVTRDPTAITTNNGDADWTAINSGSYVEKVAVGQVSAFDTTKAELLTVGSVQAGETNFIDNPSRETIDFFMIREDILFIVGYSASGSSTLIIEFGEEA